MSDETPDSDPVVVPPYDHKPFGEAPDETPIMTPPAPGHGEIKKKNGKDFWLGVGLYFLLNVIVFPVILGIFYFVTNAISQVTDYNSVFGTVSGIVLMILNFIPFVVNVGLMIYFVVKNRVQVSLGMLTGFAISLAIVVCLGVIFMALCFGVLGSYSG